MRERYINHLDPSIRKGNWAEAEDDYILAQQARMLTILALYHSYTGGQDIALLLTHFDKAKAMATWLPSHDRVLFKWSCLVQWSCL